MTLHNLSHSIQMGSLFKLAIHRYTSFIVETPRK